MWPLDVRTARRPGAFWSIPERLEQGVPPRPPSQALGHHDLRFTIEADMGHDVRARVYAGNDVYDWLLSQHKGFSR